MTPRLLDDVAAAFERIAHSTTVRVAPWGPDRKAREIAGRMLDRIPSRRIGKGRSRTVYQPNMLAVRRVARLYRDRCAAMAQALAARLDAARPHPQTTGPACDGERWSDAQLAVIDEHKLDRERAAALARIMHS